MKEAKIAEFSAMEKNCCRKKCAYAGRKKMAVVSAIFKNPEDKNAPNLGQI